jgi:hypothetical protein
LLAAIESQGGIVEKPRVEWGAHYPKTETAALPEKGRAA